MLSKKNKILRLLPKGAVSFQNPPFSPGRADGALQKPKHKGFSGPIMIPAEARTKPKSFETQEPTSPKVSCMGQIKHKKRVCKKQASLPRGFKPVLSSHSQPEKARPVRPAADHELMIKKKPSSALMRMFSGRRKSDACKPPLPERAPSLSQMRRFASSRDTFANFDWTRSQVAPEDGGGFYSGEDSDGEDCASFIPFSAPILVASARAGLVLEPRKEINLWKRRTMAQPRPLQLEKCNSNLI